MNTIILRGSIQDYPKIYTRDNMSIKVKIDITNILQNYPEGIGTIYWQYPNNGVLYILDTEFDPDGYLVATLTDNEVREPGYYKVQAEWTSHGEIIKDSYIYKLYISKSIYSPEHEYGEKEIVIQAELVEELKRITAQAHVDRDVIEESMQGLSDIEEHVGEMETHVSEMQQDVSQNTQATSEMLGEVREIAENLDQHYEEIVSIEHEVQEKSNEIENIKEDIIQRQEDIVEIQTDVTNKQTDVHQTKEEIDDIEDNIENIQTDVTSRQSTIEGIQEDINQTAEDVHSDAQVNLHPPILGVNGNWYLWDNERSIYVDSGTRAAGGVVLSDTDPGVGFDIWIDTSDET